ncbi:zinc finger protein 595-like [Haliotis cracherodii]|uniref:zinc finger protein 595-like n=1 Tax=Haliotis cracherodii TaxID=6455 RepID=UPI0039E9F81F
MDSLSELQLINDYLIRNCQEKDKFIRRCGPLLRHCQCGVVTQKILEDLSCIETRINTEEYRNLFSKTLACQDFSTDPPLDPSDGPVVSEEVQYVSQGDTEDTQVDIIVHDLPSTPQAGGDYSFSISSDMTLTTNEPVVRRIALPPYPGTTQPGTSDIPDVASAETSSALEALQAIAGVAGETGSLVVYEQLVDEEQVIVVTSDQMLHLSEIQQQANEITVLAETASLQPPISDSNEDAEKYLTELKKDFATKEEEKELLEKIAITPTQGKTAIISDKVYQCNLCEKSYNKVQTYKEHCLKHDKSRQERCKCNVCGKGFSKPFLLKIHMESHNGFKPEQCGTCGKRFAQKSSLTRHMKIHTQEKPYSCVVCDKKFNQFIHAKRHMALHSVNRQKCHLCPRTFPHKKLLDKHIEIHESLAAQQKVPLSPCNVPIGSKGIIKKNQEKRKFSCKYCMDKFDLKTDLNAHYESHAEDRPFKCELCGFRCVSERGLTFHKTSHTNSASNMCEICGRTFKYKAGLTNHLREHAGTKPFLCGQCGEGFVFQRFLTRHCTIKHNIVFQHSCKTCGHRFKSFKALKHHRASSHRRAPSVFTCRKCGEKMRGMAGLINHRRKHLEEASPEGRQATEAADAAVEQTDTEQRGVEEEADKEIQHLLKRFTRSRGESTPGKYQKMMKSDTAGAEDTDMSVPPDAKTPTVEDSAVVMNNDLTPDKDISGDVVFNKEGKPRKVCPLCNKMLHPTSIYKHIRDHDRPQNSNTAFTKSGQPRKPCSVCNVLISETSLYTHMRIHKKHGDIRAVPPPKPDDGKKRKPCKVCGKLCTESSMSKHMVLHMSERPFSCDICGRKFTQKFHVTRHKHSQHTKK